MTALQEITQFVVNDIIRNKYFWKWSMIFSGCWFGYSSFVRKIYLPQSSYLKRAKAVNYLFSLTHALLTTSAAWYFSIKYNHLETKSDIIKIHKCPSKSVLQWIDLSLSYLVLDTIYLLKYEPRNYMFYLHHLMTFMYCFALKRAKIWFNLWSLSFRVGEASTIFLNLYEFLKYSKSKKIIQYNRYNQYVFFTVFLYARLYVANKCYFYFFREQMYGQTRNQDVHFYVKNSFVTAAAMLVIVGNLWNLLVMKKVINLITKKKRN
eukprot:169822_1